MMLNKCCYSNQRIIKASCNIFLWMSIFCIRFNRWMLLLSCAICDMRSFVRGEISTGPAISEAYARLQWSREWTKFTEHLIIFLLLFPLSISEHIFPAGMGISKCTIFRCTCLVSVTSYPVQSNRYSFQLMHNVSLLFSRSKQYYFLCRMCIT